MVTRQIGVTLLKGPSICDDIIAWVPNLIFRHFTLFIYEGFYVVQRKKPAVLSDVYNMCASCLIIQIAQISICYHGYHHCVAMVSIKLPWRSSLFITALWDSVALQQRVTASSV